MSAPFLAQYEGKGAWRTAQRHVTSCDRDFEVNSWYKVEAIDERSARSHNHFFACLSDIWDSLPDGISADLPSIEHLRKYALIHEGYSNDRRIAAPSVRVAREIAAIAQSADEFAVVSIEGSVVIVRQAKSQSRAAMGKKVFQESKDAVLQFAESLIGLSPGETERSGRAAA